MSCLPCFKRRKKISAHHSAASNEEIRDLTSITGNGTRLQTYETNTTPQANGQEMNDPPGTEAPLGHSAVLSSGALGGNSSSPEQAATAETAAPEEVVLRAGESESLSEGNNPIAEEHVPISREDTPENRDDELTVEEPIGPIVNIRSPTFRSEREGFRQPHIQNQHLHPDDYLPLRTSGAPSVELEDLTDDIFPHEIHVKVATSWMEEIDWKTENSFPQFTWIRKTEYENLLPKRIIEKSKNALNHLKDKTIYHRHGTCRITAAPYLAGEHYAILDDHDVKTLIEKAIPLICGFIRDHPYRKFSLEIYWDCGYACLDPTRSNKTFSKMIRTEMDSKMKMNFLNQQYISRRDQTPFQDYDVVRDLVFHESHFMGYRDIEKDSFVKQIIQRPALKLLLNCVYQGFDLGFLRHLLEDHDCNDLTLLNTNMECEDEQCQQDIQRLSRAQSMFQVMNIDRDFNCVKREIKIEKVMPLRFASEKLLGEGASSSVYKVSIDPAHHYLSGDPSCYFALKKFSAERRREFERETDMLKVLADHPEPSDYIVSHITSWSQSSDHYILYPIATYNLRDFMKNVGPVDFTKDGTLWFLRQLQGLALAIDHVHYLKNPTATEPHPDKEAFWGCHNDIKPENILVFEKIPNHHPTFKIADFGVGVFRPAGKHGERSQLTSKAKGTRTYMAPDEKRNGGVSRPIDMWAMGCVYLELMVWLFRFFHSGRGFSSERFSCTGALEENRNNGFWHEISTPGGIKYKLKQPVDDVISELKEIWCVDMDAFLDVITAVEKLLEIEVHERWNAAQLKDEITKIVRRAEDKLQESSRHYFDQFEVNCEAERRRQAAEYMPSIRSDTSSLQEQQRDATTSFMHTGSRFEGSVEDPGPAGGYALVAAEGNPSESVRENLSNIDRIFDNKS